MTKIFHAGAFTLAEVLITIGIIGIVAAMTLPAIIQKYNNYVTETRLKKFYSTINQAVLRAEADYGDRKIWYEDLSGAEFDDEGNVIPDSSEYEKWLSTYILPYMNIAKKEILSSTYLSGSTVLYLSDGSAFVPSSSQSRDFYFFPKNVKKCLGSITSHWYDYLGHCAFAFNFYPNSQSSSWKYHYNKGFEPYKFAWNGNVSTLYSDGTYGCNSTGGNHLYCTAIIQLNGWKVPDDYPYKISY